VAALLAGCASGAAPRPTVDDSGLEVQVKARLAANPRVNPFPIQVQVQGGVVHLAGSVADEGLRREAEQEARRVAGVRGVVDDLQVGDPAAQRAVDDASLAATLRAKLTASAQLEPFGLDVAVAQGIVDLIGSVPTADERTEAERLVRATAGVRGVRNRLQVQAAP
jgi:osmotically-inducible protein OsmY